MGHLISQAESRRRNLRIVLFIIILATLPFYCAGFILWGTAPANSAGSRGTPTATFTPLVSVSTATRTLVPSITPLGTMLSPLLPTPVQFTPPGGGGGGGGVFPTAAFPTVFIPTATFAPTLTPFPTNPPPLPTNPPIPTIPIVTATPIPVASDTPIPIPSDTPAPIGGDATVEALP